MKKIFAVVSVLFLVLGLSACGSKKPEDVAIAFVESNYKGDADKMLALIHIPEEKKDEAGLKDMLSGKIKAAAAKSKEEADRKGGIKSITAADAQIDEANGLGSVQILTEFKNEGSQSASTRVKLIKSKDEWKIRL